MEHQNKKKILIVDDEEPIRKLLRTRFTRENWDCRDVESASSALNTIEQWHPDVIITDIKMPQMDGFSFMEKLHESEFRNPIIVITGHGDKECAIEALHKGAFDYLEKPFEMDEITFVVKRALETETLRSSNRRLVDELQQANAALQGKLEVTTSLLDRAQTPGSDGESTDETLVGDSESLQNLKNTIRTIADAFTGNSDPVILVTGESGVGKEVVARYIHQSTFSLKNAKLGKGAAPFVAINCTAFPEHLLESELFGYEKGAFTGATQRKLGLFELANGGTLFLDEIGDMDLRMQVKLLRVLQERVIRRLGGTQDIPVKPHIVAATNKDLAAAVQSKTFREDLYYRLNTLPLVIPPLRSRTEDIVPLAQHFLKQMGTQRGRKIKGFSPAATKALESYKWPGNVRELRSVIDRAIILEKGAFLELPQLRQETMRLSLVGSSDGTVQSISTSSIGRGNLSAVPEMNVPAELPDGQSLSDIRKAADEQFVKKLIVQYLTREHGNVSSVARLLKMDRANLLRLFRRYAIDPDLFRKKDSSDKQEAA